MEKEVFDYFMDTAGMDPEDMNREAGKRVRCTLCGKPFDMWDMQENYRLDYYCGFGSSYDGDHLRMRFCIKCFDSLMDDLIPKCKGDPYVKEIYNEEEDRFEELESDPDGGPSDGFTREQVDTYMKKTRMLQGLEEPEPAFYDEEDGRPWYSMDTAEDCALIAMEFGDDEGNIEGEYLQRLECDDDGNETECRLYFRPKAEEEDEGSGE